MIGLGYNMASYSGLPYEVDYLVWREVCDIEREVHELTANCCAQMAALDAWYADAELNGYRRR